MGLLDKLAGDAKTSVAIAAKIDALRAQQEKRSKELDALRANDLPAAEAAVTELLALGELGEAAPSGAIAKAKKRRQDVLDAIAAKIEAARQMDAIIAELDRRWETARVAEIDAERERLAVVFAEAAEKTAELVRQAAEWNRRAADARERENLLLNDPLRRRRRDVPAMPVIDARWDQAIARRLAVTVSGLENAGLLTGEPEKARPWPESQAYGPPATAMLNFRGR